MRKRWVGWACAGSALIATGAYGLAGILLCEEALRPPRQPVRSNPKAHNTTITAADGTELCAWLFVPPLPNGSAVMILHGIADSRSSQIGLARMFLSHGYTVLVPDSRAHGESGGDLATYGLLEADDVRRWVSWLLDAEHATRVYGLGESLGGAILIQSLRLQPRFSAIVAECSFASMERIALDRVAQRVPIPQMAGRALSAPAVWAAFAYARLKYGLDFRAASPQTVIAGTATPVLLIHGLADTKTPPVHSEILAARDPQTAVLWLVPGAGHTGAFGADPREFERRVLGFYQRSAFGIEAPQN